MFVTLEGIEGSGKSTLLGGLAGKIRAEGRALVETREPGGTPTGDAIREIFLNRSIVISPLTEALLVNAARAQHVADKIAPALAAGAMVLCDRFVDSTIAYQGFGRGVDRVSLRAICETATGGLEPDLTLVIDIPVPVSRQRTVSRRQAADRVESEDDAFHERVRHGYLEIARSSPRHYVLDGTLSEYRLLEDAWSVLRARAF